MLAQADKNTPKTGPPPFPAELAPPEFVRQNSLLRGMTQRLSVTGVVKNRRPDKLKVRACASSFLLFSRQTNPLWNQSSPADDAFTNPKNERKRLPLEFFSKNQTLKGGPTAWRRSLRFHAPLHAARPLHTA